MFTFQTKMSMLKALISKNSPLYVQFYISKNCYLKCKMCNIVEANTDVTPISLKGIKKIAENLARIGAGVVLLTGGEPFLRNDIDEIIRILKLKKLDIRLQTAGLYSQRDKIAQCVTYGARDINVTLHSLDQQLADYIYGVQGAWENTIKTISFISRTFPQRDSLCALGCVLSKYNADEVDAILDLATRIGWWLSLVPVHITTQEIPLNFRGYDEYFKFAEEDFGKIKTLIERLKRKKREGYLLFDSNDYLDSLYHFIQFGKPNWRRKGICDSPNLYFAILPDGRFAPCCDYRLDEDVYVDDANFPTVYNSKSFREKVKKVVRRCPGCNFGSFPEMSLSVNSLSTIIERVALLKKIKRTGIRPIAEEELFKLIEDVKEDYDVYKNYRCLKFRDRKKWAKVNDISSQLRDERQ